MNLPPENYPGDWISYIIEYSACILDKIIVTQLYYMENSRSKPPGQYFFSTQKLISHMTRTLYGEVNAFDKRN